MPPPGHRRLDEEVERELTALTDTPLAEHPRVYEALDASIRAALQEEPAS